MSESYFIWVDLMRLKRRKPKEYDKTKSFAFPKKNPLVRVSRSKRVYPVEDAVFSREGSIKDKRLSIELLSGKKSNGRKSIEFERRKFRRVDKNNRLLKKEKTTTVTRRDYQPTRHDSQFLITNQRRVYDRRTSVSIDRKQKIGRAHV